MDELNSVKVSENIIRVDSEYWHYYFRVSKTNPKITGKYLFFSESKSELEKIVINELRSGGFFHAKINTDEHKEDTLKGKYSEQFLEQLSPKEKMDTEKI